MKQAHTQLRRVGRPTGATEGAGWKMAAKSPMMA